MHAKRESRIGCLLLGGVALVVFGVFLTLMLTLSALARLSVSHGTDIGMLVVAGIGPLFILGGILSVVIGLAGGFAYNSAEKHAPLRRVPDVLILAVYGYNALGEMVFNDLDLCIVDGKLCVRVAYSDGSGEELETNWPTLAHCGEGLRGIATIKGNWLGSFQPYAPGEQRAP